MCSSDLKSTGLVALQAIAEVRADKSGLICGIGGYPKSECGVEIDMPQAQAVTTAATSTEEDSENDSEIIEGFEPIEYLAIAAALLAAIGIFVLIRRRK